jgi:hypothetical protein
MNAFSLYVTSGEDRRRYLFVPPSLMAAITPQFSKGP